MNTVEQFTLGQSQNSSQSLEMMRANAYIEAYEKTEQGDVESLKSIYSQLNQWVENDSSLLENNSLLLRINYCNCLYFSDNNDYEAVYNLFKATSTLKFTKEDYLYIAKFFRLFGSMTIDKGGYEQAITIGLKGMEYATAADSTSERIKLMNILGIAHSFSRNFNMQLMYFKQTLELARATQDIEQERLAYNNLAYSHFQNGDFIACEAFINEAEKLYNSDELDLNRLAFMLTKVALLHHQKSFVAASLLLARVQYHPKLQVDKALWMDWHLEMANHYIFTGDENLGRQQLQLGLELAILYQLESYQLQFMQELIPLLSNSGEIEKTKDLEEKSIALQRRIDEEQSENEALINAMDINKLLQ